MKCKLQKKQKNPGNGGGVDGVYERGFMKNYLFYLYHTKTSAQGYWGQKNKKTQKLKPLIMCYN